MTILAEEPNNTL